MIHTNPALIIDLRKIRHNARVITTLCHQHGIQVAGVTKGFCALPEVAAAMLAGGCTMLADSRVQNLKKLREALFGVEHLLLRAPMISEVDEVVRYAEISLNAEMYTIKALNVAAKRLHKYHRVILMIDLGDLREGVWPDAVEETVREILRCDYIQFEGIGCNLGCYGGVLTTPENMTTLLEQKAHLEATYHLSLRLISGGSTCGLQLLMSDRMPAGINHFRVGEGILLGRSTTDQFVIPGAFQDTLRIRGEIIECHRKPSVPIGTLGLDGFGETPVFEDKGIRKRAIVALGLQDIMHIRGLTPHDPQATILGATSDHLIVDITDSEQRYQIGDAMEFYPDYGCMLTAATSEYVVKEFLH